MNVSKKENDIIGKRIEKIRKAKKMKHSEVADYLGMKRANYTSTEIRNSSRYFKDYQILDLAKLFNVSADYLLGLVDEPSCDIKIKEISKEYGLTEKSLSALEFLKEKPTDFNPNIINTINYLLEDILINNHNSILNVITDYIFFTNIGNSINVPFNINSKTGLTEILTVKSDTAVKSILIKEIEEELNLLKDKIIKEGENNEHKGKSKK